MPVVYIGVRKMDNIQFVFAHYIDSDLRLVTYKIRATPNLLESQWLAYLHAMSRIPEDSKASVCVLLQNSVMFKALTGEADLGDTKMVPYLCSSKLLELKFAVVQYNNCSALHCPTNPQMVDSFLVQPEISQLIKLFQESVTNYFSKSKVEVKEYKAHHWAS